MVALGLLLVLIGGGMFGGVVYSMVTSVPVVVFSQLLGTFPEWVFFLFGMGAGAVALLGLQFIIGGIGLGARRTVRRRSANRRATTTAGPAAEPYPGAAATGSQPMADGTTGMEQPARHSRLRR